MPIAAVAAGIYAGAEIATVGIAAMSAFEVIAAVGAITSAVGALTGNDDLMKIGAVAGLAGGLGAFAQGKGWIASGNATTTAAENATGGVTHALTETVAPGVETTASLNNPSAYTAPTEAGQTAGLEGIGQNLTAANPMTQEISQSSKGLIDAAAPASPAAEAMNPTDLRLANGTQTTPPSGTLLGKGGSIFDTIKGFGKDLFFDKDGKLDKGMAAMASNFIGGAFDDAKAAKAEYDSAAADTLKTRLANGSAVPNMNFKLKPGSIWKPSAPTYNAPRPAGLFYAK